MRARDNPFASNLISRLRCHFPPSHSWDSLLLRLQRLEYRGAITGPMGSGKTTILEELAVRLEKQGRQTRLAGLTIQHRQIPDPGHFFANLESTILILDGAEQLNWLSWQRFLRQSRHAAGLIITTHQPGRLPTLFTCATTPALLDNLLTQLHIPPGSPLRLQARRLFDLHCGNLREVLRSLYDSCSTLPHPL
ncbi:MAG: hypothetical protein PHV34_24935 [Verrucomicrobiae bacterium]|nr:hypothetical protein [Verrucomicrobiae bacterium]